MKKLFSLIIAITFLFAVVPLNVFIGLEWPKKDLSEWLFFIANAKEENSGKYMLGDVDFDNEVTSADARLVLRASVGLEQFSELQNLLADVDFDNEVTSADARLILRASVGLEELKEKETELSFFNMPSNYILSSGAGAWSTELSIKADGSFEGLFHDSDAGVCYYSTFNGYFGEPKRIDENSFSISIEELNITNDIELVRRSDKIRYIPSTPYGLQNATELIVYLPETPLSEIPENCIRWVRSSGEKATTPDNYYVLCNVVEGLAFIGRK